MTMSGENYIRFDWAMKRLLRNKANYVVLEGFLSSLLGKKFKIHRFLESESNQEDEYENITEPIFWQKAKMGNYASLKYKIAVK